MTDADVVGPAMDAEALFGASSLAPGTGAVLSGLAELNPQTLAIMHGSRSLAGRQPRDQLGETVHSMTRTARLSAALVTLAFAGCGDIGTNRPNSADGASTAENAFCSAMEGAAARMARANDTTSPQALRVEFGEVVTLLDKAEEHAPAAIRDDITALGTAIDHYVVALADADYNLDVIYSTPEGTRPAEDTSHALTPEVINRMTGPCAITLE